MRKDLEPARAVERGLLTTYRKRLWNPFIGAVKRYELIQPGDKIAVCVSGGKDSMLLAKLMQLLARVSETPFEVIYLVMDPGYRPEIRQSIEQNADRLGIPITVFSTDIFSVTDRVDGSPCYLCARMRRGHLYSKARKLGCNKIALGHHFNDVIETTLLGMFYGGQLQAMIPKLHSQNFAGMELIRPLYRVHEADILAWQRHFDLSFIRCACRLTEAAAEDEGASKRQEIKALLARLKREDPDVEKRIFNSLHAVCLDTFPGYKTAGETHSFLERYDQKADDSVPQKV